MHPRYELEREYAVRILGELTEEQSSRSPKASSSEDGPAKFNLLRDEGGEGANHWYRVTRRAATARCGACSRPSAWTVSRLMRVRYGSVELPRARLKRGMWMEMPG